MQAGAARPEVRVRREIEVRLTSEAPRSFSVPDERAAAVWQTPQVMAGAPPPRSCSGLIVAFRAVAIGAVAALGAWGTTA